MYAIEYTLFNRNKKLLYCVRAFCVVTEPAKCAFRVQEFNFNAL